VTTPVAPPRYVRISLFAQLTGYSEKAVRRKIDSGAWREGVHYRKAPDGAILVDLEGYEQWATQSA
jgi:hypothetical protein